MATLLERILGTQHERQAVNFRELVVQIADGGIEPDPDLVSRVLYDSSKDHNDLREAVELLERRRQLRQQYERLPELAAEQVEVQQRIAAADAVWEEADKEHDRVVAPLSFRINELRQLTREGEDTKQELWNTCTDPALLEQMSDVQLRLTKRRQDAEELRYQIDRLRTLANDDRAEAARLKMVVEGHHQAKAYLERAKQHDRKAAECEATQAKTKAAIRDLERDEAAIRGQMLVP